MAKTNCRSFRFSDEVAAVIAQQPGKSDNDKFEQLVLRCFYELPRLENREAELQQSIMEKLQQLRDLGRIYEEVRSAENKASTCHMQLDRLYEQLHSINWSLKDVTQKSTPGVAAGTENV